MENNDLLTAEYVRSILEYDSETGQFRWKSRDDVPTHVNTRRVGTIAGCASAKGYQVLRIAGRNYQAHNIAWLHHYGEWPSEELDHADRNRTNNRIDNLRQATSSQNKMNRALSTRNTSGCKGVSFYARDGKWRAEIEGNGVRRSKTFERKEDAIACRHRWEGEVHGEFTYKEAA